MPSIGGSQGGSPSGGSGLGGGPSGLGPGGIFGGSEIGPRGGSNLYGGWENVSQISGGWDSSPGSAGNRGGWDNMAANMMLDMVAFPFGMGINRGTQAITGQSLVNQGGGGNVDDYGGGDPNAGGGPSNAPQYAAQPVRSPPPQAPPPFQINPMQAQNDMMPWGNYQSPQMNPFSMYGNQQPFNWGNYFNTFGGK